MGALNDHLELRYAVRSRAEITPPKYFDASSLHPTIDETARDRLPAGNGNDAVLRAFEAIETRIQKLTGRNEIGDTLMTTVFKQKPAPPLLDVADDNLDPSRRDYERNGYRFLFMGATIGIRNTHAHGSRPEHGDDRRHAVVIQRCIMRDRSCWHGCGPAVPTCHQTRHLMADVNQRPSHTPTLAIDITAGMGWVFNVSAAQRPNETNYLQHGPFLTTMSIAS
ncbi:TIGR02391 family protein [Nocardia sp. NBC_00508]|uniref:TIGR02391 family protein n=1 Tax=Nocardia sp. NBC_00508 TaxID=2975992 RepID=UPI003FA5B0A5